MTAGKKIYFASDIHLGHPNLEAGRDREKLVVQWLDSIKPTTAELYLLGDVFDFWYEYKSVVPRGFVRFLGKIAEFVDEGIPVHFFTGNHDIWAFDYLEKEIGVTMHKGPVEITLKGKTFYLAHGDGLGPGDYGYKLLKKVFTNRFLQFMFSRLHPNFAFWLAHSWSNKSRDSKGIVAESYQGHEGEILFQYAQQLSKENPKDFYIFGHRHLMLNIPVGDNSTFVNLGDWLWNFSYGAFDGNAFELIRYKE